MAAPVLKILIHPRISMAEEELSVSSEIDIFAHKPVQTSVLDTVETNIDL